MTPAEILDDLSHDDELSAVVQGLEAAYIEPLLATGMATTAMLLKVEQLRLHLALAQRSLAALAR